MNSQTSNTREGSNTTSSASQFGARLVWFVVVLAVGLLAVGLGHMFLNSSVFVVRSVEVAGADRLQESDILALAELDTPRNVLSCREGRIEEAVERSPWIANAEVEVSYKGTVGIEIEEREMRAAAMVGSQFIAIDREGTKIAPITSVEAETSELLVIGYEQSVDDPVARESVRTALRAVDRWERHHRELGDVRELHLSDVHGTLWVFEDGLAVRWNEEFTQQRVSVLRRTLEHGAEVRSRIKQIEFVKNDNEVIVYLNDGRRMRGELAWRQR
jgi:hypothetical protein